MVLSHIWQCSGITPDCAQGSILAGLRRTIWDTRDYIWVGCIQGKRPTCYIALPPLHYSMGVFFLEGLYVCFWATNSCASWGSLLVGLGVGTHVLGIKLGLAEYKACPRR